MDKNTRKIYIDNLSACVNGVKKPKGCAILCHGLFSSKNSEKLTRISTALAKRNIISIRFDFYAHGESAGVMDEFTINEQLKNINSIYTYIKKSYGIGKVHLIGISLGATACYLYSSVYDKNVRSLTAIVPRFDFSENTMKNFPKYNKSAYNENLLYRGMDINCKTSFFVAENDEIVDNEYTKFVFDMMYYSKYPKYYVLRNTTHRLDTKKSLSFILKKIKGYIK